MKITTEFKVKISLSAYLDSGIIHIVDPIQHHSSIDDNLDLRNLPSGEYELKIKVDDINGWEVDRINETVYFHSGRLVNYPGEIGSWWGESRIEEILIDNLILESYLYAGKDVKIKIKLTKI